MRLIISISILSFLIVSCNDAGESNKALDVQKTESTTPKKIKANAETAEGMLMMQHMINSFNEMQEENKNYAELLGELSFQCDYIIKNCSMKGAAHDSLHKVLEPILTSVQKGKNAESVEEINTELSNIRKQTEQFFARFETQDDPA